MPIAFKEWAVTVRALAEGEQLVTLRKGGIREPGKHFRLDHDRFFLYPTFDHQRPRPRPRVPPARSSERALEEGVWADGEPPAHALARRRDRPARPRAHPRLGRGRRAWTVTDRRAVDALSPYYVWTPDYAEKRLAWKRRHPLHVVLLRTYRIPRPVTVKVQRRLRRLPLLARDHARPALRGHAGALRRASSTGPPRRSRPSPPTASRPTPDAGAGRGAEASSAPPPGSSVVGIGGRRGRRRRPRRGRGPGRPRRALGRRRGDLGAPGHRPAAPGRGGWTRSGAPSRSTEVARWPDRTRRGTAAASRFAEGHMAGFLGEPVLLVDPDPGPAAIGAGAGRRRARARAATSSCSSTSAATCSPTATRRAWPARCATRCCWPPTRRSQRASRRSARCFGAGCDGELTPAEVLERVAELAAGGGLLGAWGLEPARRRAPGGGRSRSCPPRPAPRPWPASAARFGPGPIRRGRRTVAALAARRPDLLLRPRDGDGRARRGWPRRCAGRTASARPRTP